MSEGDGKGAALGALGAAFVLLLAPVFKNDDLGSVKALLAAGADPRK